MAEKKYQVVLLTMDKDSERRVESKMKKVFFVLMKRRCVKKVRKALGHTLRATCGTLHFR